MKTTALSEKDLFYLRQKKDARKMRKVYRARTRFIKAGLKLITCVSAIATVIFLMMIAITNDRLYTGTLKPIYFFIAMICSMLIALACIGLGDKLKKITTR